MKRLLCGLMLGLITFAAGVSVDSIWKANRAPSLGETSQLAQHLAAANVIWEGNQALSLCEIDADPTSFAGKTIRFRALLERNPYVVLAGSACDAEAGVWGRLELDSSELEKLPLNECSKISHACQTVHLTDAVIVGQLELPSGLSCFGPKYHVKNARIECILSSRTFDESQDSVQWFKSNSY